MSRSAFSNRFGALIGCAPIEYLARWRMALAKEALARGSKSLDRIAEEIGYESASAFSAAFRKRLGCPPGTRSRSLGSFMAFEAWVAAGEPTLPPFKVMATSS